MNRRVLLILALSCPIIALAGLYGLASIKPSSGSMPTTSHAQVSFNKPFTLTDQNGKTVTNQTYIGKPTLYFFGFTHCPDVCPTTLSTLTNWLNQFGEKSKNINVVFISIDPGRDTPASLKDYIANFHPSISAATGTPQQIESMSKIFMVYYAKVPQPTKTNPNDYTMSHSSMILMADKQGNFVGTLDSHDPETKALTKLNHLLSE